MHAPENNATKGDWLSFYSLHKSYCTRKKIQITLVGPQGPLPDLSAGNSSITFSTSLLFQLNQSHCPVCTLNSFISAWRPLCTFFTAGIPTLITYSYSTLNLQLTCFFRIFPKLTLMLWNPNLNNSQCNFHSLHFLKPVVLVLVDVCFACLLSWNTHRGLSSAPMVFYSVSRELSRTQKKNIR